MDSSYCGLGRPTGKVTSRTSIQKEIGAQGSKGRVALTHLTLSSNPNLQWLLLRHLPNFKVDSPLEVKLPHLKKIILQGKFGNTLKFLNGLRPANKLDYLELSLSCHSSFHSTSDISQTLAQFLWDHLQSRGDPDEKVTVGGRCDKDACSLELGVVQFGDHPEPPSEKMTRFMNLQVFIEGLQGEGEYEKVLFNSLKHIRNRIVYYEGCQSLLGLTDLLNNMANLIQIQTPKSSEPVSLPRWFAEAEIRVGTHSYEQILPSLKYLSLFQLDLDGGDWAPLITFLSRRVSVGKQLELLEVGGPCLHMCLEVVEEIKQMVQEFRYPLQPGSTCPHGSCPSDG